MARATTAFVTIFTIFLISFHIRAINAADSQPFPNPASPSSSSPSPSASSTPTQMFIFPRDPDDLANDDLTAQLKAEFSSLYVLPMGSSGILFWRASMTSDQVERYTGNSLIKAIIRDTKIENIIDRDSEANVRRRRLPHNQKRKAHPRNGSEGRKRAKLQARAGIQSFGNPSHQSRQKSAPSELVMISSPPNKQWTGPVDLPSQDYVYPDSAGKDVTIYIFDTGGQPSSLEYTFNKGTKRWLFIPPSGTDLARDPNDEASKTSNDNHGHRMFRSAAGGFDGVARNANVVFVAWPHTLDYTYKNGLPGDSFTEMNWLAGLGLILADIEANSLGGKCVINMSFGFPDDDIDADPEVKSQLLDMHRRLDAAGAVLTTAAGNVGGYDVDNYPGLFARDLPIIVAGAVNPYTGRTSAFSQGGPLVTIGAPGEDLRPDPEYPADRSRTWGTSYASAFTAGLVADYLSFLKIPYEAKQTGFFMRSFIVNQAYPRVDGGLPVIFNGQFWTDGPSACPLQRGMARRSRMRRGVAVSRKGGPGDEIDFGNGDDDFSILCSGGEEESVSSSSSSSSTSTTSSATPSPLSSPTSSAHSSSSSSSFQPSPSPETSQPDPSLGGIGGGSSDTKSDPCTAVCHKALDACSPSIGVMGSLACVKKACGNVANKCAGCTECA